MKNYIYYKLLQLFFIALLIISTIFYINYKSESDNQKYVAALLRANPEVKLFQPNPTPQNTFGLNLATVTLTLTAFGTISAFIFGWRNEIRNSEETALRIEKLELEIKALRGQPQSKEKKGK